MHIPTMGAEEAVNCPFHGAYFFRTSTTFDVSAAGGYSGLFDRSRTIVHVSNGSIQKASWGLGRGAVVVVRSNDATEDGMDFVALFSCLAQILAVTVTVIVRLTR